MTHELTQPTFQVGDWIAIPDRRLLRNGEVELTLEPRVIDLLICLARHAGEVVGGDQLVAEVWRGTIVSDSPIYQTLAKLRKALGDDHHEPRYIETIPKRGYRLIAPVTWAEGAAGAIGEVDMTGRPVAPNPDGGSLPDPARNARPVDAATATIGSDAPRAEVSARSSGDAGPGSGPARDPPGASMPATGEMASVAAAENPSAIPARARALRPRTATGLLIVLVTSLYAFLATSDSATGVPGRGGDAATELSVAVLPFVDMSEDGGKAYLGDGIAEQLIHTLSTVPELKVIARTSSFAFRDTGEDLVVIAERLNVGLILEGSVRTSGDQIRISAQLVDGRDGFHVWSRTFEQPIGDIFDIQDAIARDVAALMVGEEKTRLIGPVRYATHDRRAWELYLLGHHQMQMRRADTLQRAIDYFDRAIDRDASFALAWAELSFTWFLSSDRRYGQVPDETAIDRAELAAQQALAIDERLPEVWNALQAVRSAKGDASGAVEAGLRAYELNPGSAKANVSHAGYLFEQGRVEEATAAMERAVELDPLSAVHRMNLANYYGLLGMPERSRGQLEKAMEVAPDWHMPFTVAAYDAYFAGQFDVAARHGGHAATVEGPEARLAHSAAWLTANAWLSLGEFSTARQWLAYALDSGKPQWWIDQAEIRIRLAEGRDADAHALLESWVAGIPTDKDCCLWHRMIQSNADAWGYAALIELMLGHPEHAQADYARAEAVAADATDAGSPPWDARDWPFADNDLLQWGYLPANQWAWLRRRANREEAAGRLLDESFAFLDSLADERPAGPGEAYVAACAHALRGEQRQALALLDHAVEAGWARPLLFARDPCLDSLRRRTEFIAIADRIDRSLLAQRDALADTPALVQGPVSR